MPRAFSCIRISWSHTHGGRLTAKQRGSPLRGPRGSQKSHCRQQLYTVDISPPFSPSTFHKTLSQIAASFLLCQEELNSHSHLQMRSRGEFLRVRGGAAATGDPSGGNCDQRSTSEVDPGKMLWESLGVGTQGLSFPVLLIGSKSHHNLHLKENVTRIYTHWLGETGAGFSGDTVLRRVHKSFPLLFPSWCDVTRAFKPKC